MSVQTDGLYNPFILPALQRQGYVHSATAAHGPAALDYTKRTIVLPDELEIGDSWARIPHGSALDLGGCGKGYIVDALITKAKSLGVIGGWVNASGDIAGYGNDQDGQLFTIEVQTAAGAATVAPITIPQEGVGIATSGTYRRPGHAIKTHHIIDPRTNHPSTSDINLATVTAPDCLVADVLATCAIIAGSQHAPAYLATHGALSWVLQGKQGTQLSDDYLKGQLRGSHA